MGVDIVADACQLRLLAAHSLECSAAGNRLGHCPSLGGSGATRSRRRQELLVRIASARSYWALRKPTRLPWPQPRHQLDVKAAVTHIRSAPGGSLLPPTALGASLAAAGASA